MNKIDDAFANPSDGVDRREGFYNLADGIAFLVPHGTDADTVGNDYNYTGKYKTIFNSDPQKGDIKLPFFDSITLDYNKYVNTKDPRIADTKDFRAWMDFNGDETANWRAFTGYDEYMSTYREKAGMKRGHGGSTGAWYPWLFDKFADGDTTPSDISSSYCNSGFALKRPNLQGSNNIAAFGASERYCYQQPIWLYRYPNTQKPFALKLRDNSISGTKIYLHLSSFDTLHSSSLDTADLTRQAVHSRHFSHAVVPLVQQYLHLAWQETKRKLSASGPHTIDDIKAEMMKTIKFPEKTHPAPLWDSYKNDGSVTIETINADIPEWFRSKTTRAGPALDKQSSITTTELLFALSHIDNPWPTPSRANSNFATMMFVQAMRHTEVEWTTTCAPLGSYDNEACFTIKNLTWVPEAKHSSGLKHGDISYFQ